MNKGLLYNIVIFFVCAVFLKISFFIIGPDSLSNQAMAKENTQDKQDLPPTKKEEKKSPIEKRFSPNVCITADMLKAANVRFQYLNQREKEISEQAKLLEISDRRVREQVSKLGIIKEKIIEQAALADSKIAKESKRLISIYEKMNPKAAASIFDKMSPAVAAELLRNMKEDQSSAILAKMLPQSAYDVTLSLAKGIKTTEENYKKLY